MGVIVAYRWKGEAERAANDQVTYALCGWGRIDLRLPLLRAVAVEQDDVGYVWQVAEQFDAMLRERRRLEARLAAAPAMAPPERRTGLFATAGCPDTLRRSIEAHHTNLTTRATR
ncbi:MAG: hypothetical protein GVY13_14730 [Alphaproteobacteria bacterium]|nr:hypothetical protein [Alphaproteobacteria bacterium]